jgi:DNA-binding NarL/FixJ family response regulator
MESLRVHGSGMGGDLAARALDALDYAVVIFSADLSTVLHMNEVAGELIARNLSLRAVIAEAADTYINAREDTHRIPPALRIETDGSAFYLRAVGSPGHPPAEIIFIREEVLRDVDVFRLLNARHGVSRREYDVLSSLRLGKTNREIAAKLGIAEGTVGRHIHRLLERFDAPNRTRLADLVEQIIVRRG